MRALLNYLESNFLEAMLAGSVVLIIYSLLRRFRAHRAIALLFAFSPLMLFWSIRNAPVYFGQLAL